MESNPKVFEIILVLKDHRSCARESLAKIDDIMHGIKKDVQLHGRADPLELELLAQRLKMHTEKLRKIAD